jgi:hypothetical protein
MVTVTSDEDARDVLTLVIHTCTGPFAVSQTASAGRACQPSRISGRPSGPWPTGASNGERQFTASDVKSDTTNG